LNKSNLSPARTGRKGGESSGRCRSNENNTRTDVNVSREDRENLRHKIYQNLFKGKNMDQLEMFPN